MVEQQPSKLKTMGFDSPHPLQHQERLGPEFEKVLFDNLWELYAREPTMRLSDAERERVELAYERELQWITDPKQRLAWLKEHMRVFGIGHDALMRVSNNEQEASVPTLP